MNAPTVQGVMRELEDITNFLVEEGIANDQNYPVRRDVDRNTTRIEYANMLPVSSMMKDVRYADLYYEQVSERSFNVRLLDGAIVQIAYEFYNGKLRLGRLGFLPSPDLSQYQNDPELYEEDLIFAEVIDRQVVTVPIRFDFDSRSDVAQDLHHPFSHVTLGQYKNCRIAATAALTPGVFFEFILRSFYNTASRQVSERLPRREHRFDATITKKESVLLHVAIP